MGGHLRPGNPQETRPHLAHTPIAACLRPPASTKRVPTVYSGEGNHSPCPAHPRKATGAGASSGATKGSCRLRSVLRRCPWGLLPSLHTMGVGWRTLAPLWALALGLACAQHTGETQSGWLSQAGPGHDPMPLPFPHVLGWPWSPAGSRQPEAVLGSGQAECVREQLQQLSLRPSLQPSCNFQLVGLGWCSQWWQGPLRTPEISLTGSAEANTTFPRTPTPAPLH